MYNCIIKNKRDKNVDGLSYIDLVRPSLTKTSDLTKVTIIGNGWGNSTTISSSMTRLIRPQHLIMARNDNSILEVNNKIMIQYKQFDYEDDDEEEDEQDSNNKSPDNLSHAKINFDSSQFNKCLTDISLKKLPPTSSVNTILNNKNPSLTIKTESSSLSED